MPADLPATAAPAGAPLTVVVAPDSFKGSLSSLEVASALAAGWRSARPGDRLLLAPLADGGEGTLVAVEAAGGWDAVETTVHDPLGRPIRARWLRSSNGRQAFVEMAAASGLSRLAPAERDPVRASTGGTGDLLLDVLDTGIRRVTLGIGGSATTDGGWGVLETLGARRGDDARLDLAGIDLDGLDPRLAELELRVACDVTNPLLGPAGAAAVYGPQKGATPDLVAFLDARLARFADALEAATGRRERDTPGAGAAGGLGFGLLCLADRLRALHLEPGIDLLMEVVDLAGKLEHADLVVTGEGRIDAQTAYGKTALGVARRATSAGLPCLAVCGGLEPEGVASLAGLGVLVVPVSERPQSVESAMAAGAAPLERCGERLARLVSLGGALAAGGTRDRRAIVERDSRP